MDQPAREDIAAAAAAHHELGPQFDGAIAEGLVERIGAEIDKRVDARIGDLSDRSSRPARRRTDAPASSGPSAGLAIWSMVLGIGATAVVLNSGAGGGLTSNGLIGLAVLIWVIIGVINIAHTRRH